MGELNIKSVNKLWEQATQHLKANGIYKDEVWQSLCFYWAMEVSKILEEVDELKTEGKDYLGTLAPFRFTAEPTNEADGKGGGGQAICEFAVLDRTKRDNSDQVNWHLQNTSQWVYAGAIVISLDDGRVSTHH